MTSRSELERSMGLFGATGVGVGAIVGGGILALAGVAFANTGPSAMIAFALNGVIAFITALSFAELATQFPHSGGAYTFAKKILGIQGAFGVGWVAWFASIVAAVLYAYGFGAFVGLAVEEARGAFGITLPAVPTGRTLAAGLGVAATLVCTVTLARRTSGGGHWLNIGKVLAFAIIIAGGLWALIGSPHAGLREHLTPFFSHGATGLFHAMGYTFIALQGFDLIAAVAGEIRNPERTIPRAMFLSLGIALAIYLPLLFLVATIGIPAGETVSQLSMRHPEAIVAIAARQFIGPFGYWLVVAAGILAMLSALQANLLAASRISRAMAVDRTLPSWLETLHSTRRTPVISAVTTAAIVITILLLVPHLAAIGAASSLIFLILFALVQRMTIVARQRGGVGHPYFHTPWFPVVPIIGVLACSALAISQGISDLTAGAITLAWLAVGAILFMSLLGRRARTVDASALGLDADLARLRGYSPLVLVPMANPSNAPAMVGVATAMAAPGVGRVMLLTVISPPDEWQPDEVPESVQSSQSVIQKALTASFVRGLKPAALMTVAEQPWQEIARVARTYRCESLLLGLSSLTGPDLERRMETLMSGIDCDVVVLRAFPGWLLQDVRRVLVPIGGRGNHDELRARLLASIHRLGAREITLLRVLPERADNRAFMQAKRDLARIARDEVPSGAQVIVLRSDDGVEEICRYAGEADLAILGLQRLERRRRVFGDVAVRIAQQTTCGLVMIGRKP